MRNYLILAIASFFACQTSAQIYCPSDLDVTCFSALTIAECGNATVLSGNYHPSQVKFEDDDQTNACNAGVVYRKFYIDIDYSNDFTEGEPSCTQTIVLNYDALPLNIQYPAEIELTCEDEIPDTHPTWLSHPCDLVGYTYEDEEFEFEDGACRKIVRSFSVINWCEYDADNGTGLFSGTQIIKVIDNIAPEITGCDDVTIDAVENCEAQITLTNMATDVGDCPSSMLQWTLSVDLWADGTEDLFFGPNEPAPFKIDEVVSGETVSIDFPERLGISKNKLVWKVYDGCGNVRSCSNELRVEDNKPPTPYCKAFLSATLNGAHDGNLVIPASLFANGGFDNCSSEEEIQISFSDNVDDTVREVACGETGLRFFNIYYTDAAGNQDFCEVFMLIIDNGSCSGTLEQRGTIMTRDGSPMVDVTAYLMDDDQMIEEAVSTMDGSFSFGAQGLMDTYYTKAYKEDDPMVGLDLMDYQLMMNAALGKENIDYYQRIAADLNDDGQFDIEDLAIFRDVFTGKHQLSEKESWKFVPAIQEENTSAAYDEDLSITDYGYGYDFWAVKRGDLTGTQSIQSAEKNETFIPMEIIVSDHSLVIKNESQEQVGFYKIDVKDNWTTLRNTSKTADSYALQNGSRIANLSHSSIELKINDIYIEVIYEDLEDIEEAVEYVMNNAQFTSNNQDELLSIIWTVDDRRGEEFIEEIQEIDVDVYPTIFNTEIRVEGEGVFLFTLRNMAGQIVKTTTSTNDNLTIIEVDEAAVNGIYLLEIVTNRGIETTKLIKG